MALYQAGAGLSALVGIGTTNPSYQFHVSNVSTTSSTSAAFLTPSLGTSGVGNFIQVGTAISTYQSAALGFLNYGTNTSNVCQISINGAGGSAINIISSGVGIGTTSLGGGQGKLFVANDVTLASGNYAGDVSAQIMAVGSANPLKRLALMYDTTNNIGLVQAMIAGTGTSPLILNGAGGNVGIGTTNPSYTLDVNGTIATRTDIRFNGTGLNASDKKLYSPADGDLEWMTNTAAGVHGFAVSNQGTKIVYLNTNGNSYLNGGNVGIGTANPYSKLDVYGAIGTSNVTTNSHGFISQLNGEFLSIEAFNSGNTGKLPVALCAYGGNVGIGTTSPGYPLDVNGDMHCSGAIWCGNNSGATAAGSIGGRMYFGGTYGDQDYPDGGQILSRLYATPESSELVIFKGNDVAGASGPDRIRLRAGVICFDTYPAATSDPTATNIQMTIDGGGNVGIGTSSLGGGQGKLYVANDVTLASGNYAGDVSAQIMAVGSTNPLKRLALMYDTTNNIGLVQAMIAGTGPSPLILNAAGGNVGIGTTNPVSVFNVYNGTTILSSSTSNAGEYVSPSTLHLRHATNTSTQLIWECVGLNTAAITAGSTAPYGLSYGTQAGDHVFRTGCTYSGDFSTTGSERMRITAAGRVGINNAAPQSQATLEVNSCSSTYGQVTAFAASNTSGWIAGSFGSSTGGDRVVIGTLNGMAHVGSHNAALNAWVNLTINQGGNTGIGSSTNPTSYTLQVTGTIGATGDITALYSDERLKTKTGTLTGALDKVCSLETFTYRNNELAQSFGFKDDYQRVGVSAQQVQKVLPEAVRPAPFDAENQSGQNYLTVQYEKLVPLLIEALKEERSERLRLQDRLERLERLLSQDRTP